MDDLYSNLFRINMLLYSGRSEEALNIINKILEKEPNNIYALNAKGYALYLLGKYGEALKYYNKALEIDPNTYQVWFNKGDLYYKMEKYEKSIECYNKVIDICSRMLDLKSIEYKVASLIAIGDIKLKLREYESSMEYYKKASDTILNLYEIPSIIFKYFIESINKYSNAYVLYKLELDYI